MEITQLIAVLQEMAHNDAALREAVLTISVCVCLDSLPSLWVSQLSEDRLGFSM